MDQEALIVLLFFGLGLMWIVVLVPLIVAMVEGCDDMIIASYLGGSCQ